MKQRAFTLIELLVVIAIISILASMLFPVFSRARAKGRQAACISNQKQIVLAMLMYAEDFDETLPFGSVGNPPLLWYRAIYPYTHNYQILYCPDRKDKGPAYGMNWHASGQAVGQMWDAAAKILVGDVLPDVDGINAQPGWPNAPDPTEWWINDIGNDADPNNPAPSDNSYTALGKPQPHNDGVIYGFGDGHVKWMKEELVDNPVNWLFPQQ
jgi:prepilin-type N-terminal cleavage/methylation domain-containing protein/prepilin-type processing-associated H-X9-DG protein